MGRHPHSATQRQLPALPSRSRSFSPAGIVLSDSVGSPPHCLSQVNQVNRPSQPHSHGDRKDNSACKEVGWGSIGDNTNRGRAHDK